MNVFFESPVTILIVGFLLFGITFYFWKETRLKPILYLMLGIAALTIILVFVEHFVETDNESLKDSISSLARAVENNDIETAVSFFSIKAKDARQMARAEMPSYTFRTCRVVKFAEIRVNENARPKTAEVDFIVFVDVNAPRYQGYDGPASRGVTLNMELENDEWLVTGYQHYPVGPVLKTGGRR